MFYVLSISVHHQDIVPTTWWIYSLIGKIWRVPPYFHLLDDDIWKLTYNYGDSKKLLEFMELAFLLPPKTAICPKLPAPI